MYQNDIKLIQKWIDLKKIGIQHFFALFKVVCVQVYLVFYKNEQFFRKFFTNSIFMNSMKIICMKDNEFLILNSLMVL